MLVNLMPPLPELEGVALREPDIVVSPPVPAGGFMVVHPRYRNWLTRCGATSAAAALALPGEIVSGHPERHVLQVTIQSGGISRKLFLKREHVVGRRERRRNTRAGFGPVSRAEREAKVLDKLEAAGLPGPHWVAYGEDGRGRAFLLVDELTGYRELRELLADGLSPADRRAMATRLGESLADLHAAGFDTPDLAAKHVFVRPGSFSTTVLDWQSAGAGTGETLAVLHATVIDGLATVRDRLRVLRAYLRRMRELGSATRGSGVNDGRRVRSRPSPRSGEGGRRPGEGSAACPDELPDPGQEVAPLTPGCAGPSPQRGEGMANSSPPMATADGRGRVGLAALARRWHSHSLKLLTRSSVRDQRQPQANRQQRLVWLAEEAVCVVPDVAKLWPRPADCSPYYPAPGEAVEDGERRGVRLAADRPATLVRFRTTDVVGRVWAHLRGKSWRSPAAKLARLLFHLQKAGVPVPPLFAFGQKLPRFRPAASFFLYGLADGTATLDGWLARLDDPAEREHLFAQLGGLVRAAHDADCRLGASPAALRVTVTKSRPQLVLDPTHGAALVKTLGDVDRARDLAGLLRAFAVPATADECRWLLDGYARPGAFETLVLRLVSA